MGGNAFPLQRRRRRSNPSPTSPVFARRAWEKQDIHLSIPSPAEPFSAILIGSESPALDVKVPSPTFDLPSFSATSPTFENLSSNHGFTGRSSDEFAQQQQQRRQPFLEPVRPSTSAAATGLSTSRPSRFPAVSPALSSPVNSNPAPPSFEHFPPISLYQESRNRMNEPSPPAPRNFGSPVPMERSMFEDNKNYPPKKSRLDYLKPGRLLARRRASATGKDGDTGLTVNTSGVVPLPEGDVSIRGTRVIDFSARRPRRVLSHDASSGDSSPLTDSRPSLQEQRRSSDLAPLHASTAHHHGTSPIQSPLYKERVDDNNSPLQPAQAAYLQSLAKATNIRGDYLSSNQPKASKRLPIRIPEKQRFVDSSSNPLNRLPVNVGQADKDEGFQDVQPTSQRPPEGHHSPKLDVHLATTLPRHMASTSSRFSFQLGNQDSSAQERLLEEKHKQQQASKQLSAIDAGEEPQEEDYGNYDFDDDGLEERIPGVNADADEDDLELERFTAASRRISTPRVAVNTQPDRNIAGQQTRSDGLDGFHFTSEAAIFSPSNLYLISEPTPKDDEGQRIGIANSNDSPTPFLLSGGGAIGQDGLGIGGIGDRIMSAPGLTSADELLHEVPVDDAFNDEDLYFDDGDFDHDSVHSLGQFDESILDDESGQIRDIPSENARKFEAAQRGAKFQSSLSRRKHAKLSRGSQSSLGSGPQRDADTHVGGEVTLKPPESTVSIGGGTSLTEGNLAAYHNALVSAANEAAANGRFDRTSFHSQSSDDWASQSQQDESQPGLVSDDSRLSHLLGASRIGEEDAFAFDDDYGDDDLMIAEANAEALENDDEGFYGQEFGFYARAPGKGSSELTNGGYFGPKGSGGIKRSYSAKANFQEPTLTPITERSEWSTRNSVSSNYVPALPGSANTLQSPGIAQLLDMESTNMDDEMSLSALMKLRRGAFGGSSNSISSLTSSHTAGSPLGHVSHHAAFPHGETPRLTSSIHSLSASVGIPESEEEEEEEEGVAIPTLTQSSPNKKLSDPSPITPSSQVAMSPSLGTGKPGHSRTSSGAESVSYIRDPDGSDRWLLERRRTGDHGELELVGREYLAGARI